MPSEDVYKVSLFYHTSQRQMIATHFYEAGLVVPTDPFEEAQALAEAWSTIFLTAYANVLAIDTQIGCVKVEQVKGTGIPFYVMFYENASGLVLGDPMPANMALIFRRRGVFSAKMRRSLLFLGGISVLTTNGSFTTPAFTSGPAADLSNLFNDGLVAGSEFNLAQFNPVLPVTERVYATKVAVDVDTNLNEMTLTDGTNWQARGFITGGQFRINAPNRNKGTYNAIVQATSPLISLVANGLEESGPQVLSCQQVISPTQYITLQSSIVNTALRQLSRRRSSHTGIVG